jgi:branched-chain amino acid aminotransferase
MEVTPIYNVDKYAIGSGEQGEWTKKIHQKYLECAQGKMQKYRDWLTAVY